MVIKGDNELVTPHYWVSSRTTIAAATTCEAAADGVRLRLRQGDLADLAERNFTAAGVALELLAWDKNRASPGPVPTAAKG